MEIPHICILAQLYAAAQLLATYIIFWRSNKLFSLPSPKLSVYSHNLPLFQLIICSDSNNRNISIVYILFIYSYRYNVYASHPPNVLNTVWEIYLFHRRAWHISENIFRCQHSLKLMRFPLQRAGYSSSSINGGTPIVKKEYNLIKTTPILDVPLRTLSTKNWFLVVKFSII
jgi:hypothetical protein